MKKFIVASALALSLLVPGVAFAALSETQIAAVLGLLRAFNADASALYDIEASLRGEVLGATVACPALTMTLQRGMSDATTKGQVTELQKFLSGYYALQQSDAVTGYFGAVTLKNLLRFQVEQGISALGIVGPQTRARIAVLCAGSSVSTTPILKPGPICPAIGFIPMECAVGAPAPRYDANGCQTGWSCTATSTTAMLNASLDVSSPAYALVAAGTKDVPLAAYRFTATGQSVTLQKVRLALASGSTPQAVPADLEKVTLWNGTTKIGEGFFIGNSYGTVITLTQSVYIQAGTSLVLTIKGDIAPIGIAEPVSVSGHLVQVGVDTGFSDTTGQSLTGTTVIAGGAPGFPAGVRVAKSFPTVAPLSLPNAGALDGRLMRFSVTADPRGSIGLAKLTFSLDAVGLTVGTPKVYAFSDPAFSSPIGGVEIDGGIPTGAGGPGYAMSPLSPIQVPAGATRYFEIRAPVSGTGSITTDIRGDATFSEMKTASQPASSFVWSPNSITTSGFSTADWTNGHLVPGIMSWGMRASRTNYPALPAPSITAFSASPTSITPGQSSTLSWASNTGTVDGGCMLFDVPVLTTANQPITPSGSWLGNGSFTVTPAVTTTYLLKCFQSFKDGSLAAQKTVTVTVQTPIAPKPIACPLMIYTPVTCTGTTLPKYDANGCLTGVICEAKPVTETGTVRLGSDNSSSLQ